MIKQTTYYESGNIKELYHTKDDLIEGVKTTFYDDLNCFVLT